MDPYRNSALIVNNKLLTSTTTLSKLSVKMCGKKFL
jgi:hypothetical protein